jgi:hypothetical protein
VNLKRGQHSKYLPFVFTEQGVAMLSSVLKSEKAVHVNIQIMRAFIMMRKISISNDQLNQKIIAQERKYDRSDFKTPSKAQRLRCRPPVNAHIHMYAALSLSA